MTSDDQHRAIGTVTAVSAESLTVELHRKTDNFMVVGFDDMQYVAQIGSYILIPVQSEYVVAEIVNLREKDLTATSIKEDVKGMDKAMSVKYLEVVPVGSLTRKSETKSPEFKFGVSTFPSLYADALYITSEELDVIFKVLGSEIPGDGGSRWKSLQIGRSPIFGGYDIKIDIDNFFGGHAAVLGNTGSGKSCTVASILQSLFSKPKERKARGATFILLDVNGEYSDALKEGDLREGISTKTLTLDGSAGEDKFTLPHWFLTQEEWELLLNASEKAQKPALRSALGLTELLADSENDDIEKQKVKQHIISMCILGIFQSSEGAITTLRKTRSLLSKYPTGDLNMNTLSDSFPDYKYGSFNKDQEEKFLNKIRTFLSENMELPNYQNSPFEFARLEECLDYAILYEEAHGNKQIRDYCSSLITRLNSLNNREDFNFLKLEGGDLNVSEAQKLVTLLGLDNCAQKKQDQIIILDMNSVGDEVVELVSAVLSRMIFDLLRKQKNEYRNKFPVHLVLEEAHRYVAQKPSNHPIDATQIFEKIAKEGRKYGMFLMVASQRPSELSKTVLSQCANFIVHRIQNPDDLEHIRKMTPFVSRNVLDRLTSLPKQSALIFGNAVTIPTIFKVRQAYPLPRSDDAKISESWFIKKDQPIKLDLEAGDDHKGGGVEEGGGSTPTEDGR